MCSLSSPLQTQLSVLPILSFPTSKKPHPPEVYFSSDLRVNNLMRLIESGHIFGKHDWVGGDASLGKLCLCNRKKNNRCTCGISNKGGRSLACPVDAGLRSHSGYAEEIAALRAEVRRLKEANEFNVEKLRLSIVSELKTSLGLPSFNTAMTSLQNTASMDFGTPNCPLHDRNLTTSPPSRPLRDTIFSGCSPVTGPSSTHVPLTSCAPTLSTVRVNNIFRTCLPRDTSNTNLTAYMFMRFKYNMY